MGTKEKGQKAKKPFYKKWWFWVIVVILLGAAGSGLSGNDKQLEPSVDQTETQDLASTPEDDPAEARPEPETDQSKDHDEKRSDLNSALGGSVLFYESVRNDTTGKWRLLVYSSSENIVDHAVEYYNAYFSSDSEVHIAVNLGLETTSVMTVAMDSMSLDVHEYIDGEEHDAKILGGGDLLKKYSIDLSTGTVDDLSIVPTDDGDSVNLDDLASAILADLPGEYQGSKWLNASCDYDESGIFVIMQVDQGNSDTDTALSLAADCFTIAKKTVEDNGLTFGSISTVIVNDGSPLGIYTTENGKDFAIISDGKRTEVSLP